jgi:hypothetical protein
MTTGPGMGMRATAMIMTIILTNACPFQQQWIDNPNEAPRQDDMSDLASSQSASPPPPSNMAFGVPPSISTPGGGMMFGDEEVIPTAIVIKNIPFNVKREALLDIIVGLDFCNEGTYTEDMVC